MQTRVIAIFAGLVWLAVGVLAVLLLSRSSAAPFGASVGTPDVAVTLFPTETPSARPLVATVASAPAPTRLAFATVTPQPAPTEYIVRAGDTFWDIALRFRLSLDELTFANPNINPNLIHPGDRIIIPNSGTMLAAPAPSGPHVAADAEGLRLRAVPDLSAEVLRYLNALTPLSITARTPNSDWLEVVLRDGARGWVASAYVAQASAIAQAPVKVAAARPSATPMTSAALNRTPIPAGNAPAAPFVSGFTEAARQIYQRGQSMGNHPRVFAVVGDSNSVIASFLRPFDRATYDLGEHAQLEETIKHFKGSFEHNSNAAVIGYTALRLLTPPREAKAPCAQGESLLACEYRVKKPSVALILLGTNDSSSWRTFEEDYRDLVEFTIARGIVPVLMTKGDALETQRYGAPPEAINKVIMQMSQRYGVPLVDLRAAVLPLPNGGMVSDGFHFNTPPDGKAAHFTGVHLNYGLTMRNLTALQALDAARRLVIGD